MKLQNPVAPVALLSLALVAGCEQNAPQTSVSIPNVGTQKQPSSPAKSAAPISKKVTHEELSAPANGSPALDAELSENSAIELEWDALIPADWRPDKLMEEYDADNLSDDDPRAMELMEKLKTLWKESPVVHDYDGKIVKLPGFVVPLEMDAKTIREFLLVPYYGACIHVPPPPSNQTVHVVTDENHAYRGELFDTVWVTGTITVEKRSSELGEAGYRIEARNVEPYQ